MSTLGIASFVWNAAMLHLVQAVSILGALLPLLVLANALTRRLWSNMHERLLEVTPIPQNHERG